MQDVQVFIDSLLVYNIPVLRICCIRTFVYYANMYKYLIYKN